MTGEQILLRQAELIATAMGAPPAAVAANAFVGAGGGSLTLNVGNLSNSD